jgi:hypothetical protein
MGCDENREGVTENVALSHLLLSYMSPKFVVNNSVDGLRVNQVLSSQNPAELLANNTRFYSLAPFFTDNLYEVVRKLSSGMSFANWSGMAVAVQLVLNVIFLTSKVKVANPYTLRIITMMVNLFSFWYRAVGPFPEQPRRSTPRCPAAKGQKKRRAKIVVSHVSKQVLFIFFKPRLGPIPIKASIGTEFQATLVARLKVIFTAPAFSSNSIGNLHVEDYNLISPFYVNS